MTGKDDDETGTHILRIRSENGVEQDREVTIINEAGLYSALKGVTKAPVETTGVCKMLDDYRRVAT